MGCLAVHGRLGRAALLIIEGRTREFGGSVMVGDELEQLKLPLSVPPGRLPASAARRHAADVARRHGLLLRIYLTHKRFHS